MCLDAGKLYAMGKMGYLVPLKDIKSLANTIEELTGDHALMSKMGKRSREIVIAEFSEEIVVKKTMDLYNNLLRIEGFGSDRQYNNNGS